MFLRERKSRQRRKFISKEIVFMGTFPTYSRHILLYPSCSTISALPIGPYPSFPKLPCIISHSYPLIYSPSHHFPTFSVISLHTPPFQTSQPYLSFYCLLFSALPNVLQSYTKYTSFPYLPYSAVPPFPTQPITSYSTRHCRTLPIIYQSYQSFSSIPFSKH